MNEEIERLTEERDYWREACRKGEVRELNHLKEIERLSRALDLTSAAAAKLLNENKDLTDLCADLEC